MIWALLAAYLTKRPPWVQSTVVGLCTGLFVAAAANADTRDPLIGSVVLQVLAVGVVAGAAFFVALRSRLRRGPADGGPPAWVHAVYGGVWLLAIGAAAWALLGDGGFKVAVLAIVPIVLLAPPALLGIRALTHRTSRTGARAPADPRA
jgi:heme/copper-type cytochrome/quinol oxidase subunit 2